MFRCRLALALGKFLWEVDELMPLPELHEWMWFDERSPIGDIRGDIQAGTVAAIIANVNRKKGAKPYSATDFVPKFGRPKQQSDDEIESKIMSWASAIGAKDAE